MQVHFNIHAIPHLVNRPSFANTDARVQVIRSIGSFWGQAARLPSPHYGLVTTQ